MKEVGVEENFFELGGHSLLATQVISRVREALKVDLPLQSFFEYPTVAGLAEQISKARGDKRIQHSIPIERVSREGEIPLSFTQQRFWFLDQLEQGNPAYNLHVTLRISGRLNVTALEQAICEIGRRHEALRTSFSAISGRPVQVVAADIPIVLSVTDFAESGHFGREARIEQSVYAEVRKPFDLERVPLLRARLLQLDVAENALLVTMHHIISDGWSLEVFVKELAELYQAFSKGLPTSLAELPVQYIDFAAWERQTLQREMLDSMLAYWKQQLAGARLKIDLPTDKARPAIKTYLGATMSCMIPASLTRSLKLLSSEEKVTLNVSLLAAFQTLLHRYTGQDDIVVGSPVANRGRAEVEGMIGCFLNTLALRANLSGNPRFNDLLKRVGETTLKAQAHQHAPFDLVMKAVQPERKGANKSILQVWFIFQQTLSQPVDISPLKLTPMSVDAGTAQADLTLFMYELGDEIVASLNYSTDLFERATIAEMLERYKAILEWIVADRESRILDIPLEQGERRFSEGGFDAQPASRTEDQFAFNQKGS